MPSYPHLVANRLDALKALPAGHSIRWVAARKAQVVDAVENGLLRIEDALVRYRLSLEEFEGWQRARRLVGLSALHAKQQRVRGFGRKGAPRRPSFTPHAVS